MSPEPWRDNKNWQHGRVCSTARKEAGIMWLVAIVFTGISFPVVWTALPQELAKGNWPALVALVFPLAGLSLLYGAVRKTLEWRRFGRLYLDLDPFPGSLGGDVGGSVELRLPYALNLRFDVALSCVHSRVSGYGKSRRRHEEVIWRGKAVAPGEPGMRGTRVRFRFAVPDRLPQSEPASDDYHYWVVHLAAALPGVDLDRTFEVPVFQTQEPLRNRDRVPYAAEATASLEPPGSIVRVYRGTGGLRLDYPTSRSRGTGLAALLFGLVFLGAPFAIATGSGWPGLQGGSGLSIGMLPIAGLMGLVFGLVGLGVTLTGVYLMANGLQVQVSERSISTRRRLFGIPVSSRSVPSEQVTAVDHRIGMQTGQGARATVRYSVHAHLRDGGTLCLGDGLKGKPLADHVLNLIRDSGRFDNSSPTPWPRQRERGSAPQDPAARRGRRSIRWAGALLAVALFASFAYEAFSMFTR